MGADLRSAGLIVTIPAGDLDRARSFYEGALGFGHLSTSEAGVLLQAGSGRVLLYHSLAATPGHDLPRLRTVDHIAWIGPERAAWFRDSEGNILSISEPWRTPPDEAAQ